ncbi:hypothetical protein QVD17_01703 [Tagetes erecta]|uniref:ARM repeat superfamily protein n=1 Tax=Tagetes erecta TaxID=13708 RepID=A0AAD8P1Q9_TARER|nr:hypothetical protein QVD17_01703 [Tagetes erecta]
MDKQTPSQTVIHLQIHDQAPAIFEPQSSIETAASSSNTPSVSGPRQQNRAPEKRLTLFALRLAVLEKAATGLGTLGFIWATVVLLGGFAITIDKTDFWFITIILLIEGTRIFSRSHELEWQHQATWSLADAGMNSFHAVQARSHVMVRACKAVFKVNSRKDSLNIRRLKRKDENWEKKRTLTRTRTWSESDVPLLPYVQWVFLSRNISRLLYWLQLASATACVVLSLIKLVKQNYGEIEKGDTDKRNRKSALTIFYALALAEALLFLLEKAYWEWKVMYKKLLERVNDECEFGPIGLVSVRRFFYDSYSKCVNGSIFDGLKMDLVSFAMELLDSGSSDEQLIGVRILEKFTKNPRFSEDTLQKIGITITVIERLVEMLNWKDPQEEEIRKSAAEILAKLAGKKQNSLRVAGIPGAMESISSLLHTHRNCSATNCGEIAGKEVISDQENYGFWAFNELGLQILKKLARDHDNCGKIGNTKGLLAKIIDFTHAPERLLKDERVTESQISTVKRSLQVLKMLVSTTGSTGRQLRSEISEVVFTVSYIRDILRYGEKHPMLQKLGIEILTSLALEVDATERIGGTGGVLKELLNIFFKRGMPEDQNHVRIAAGEALGMLAFESVNNCHRILKLKVVDRLVDALDDPLLRINSARILRNLCIYSGPQCFQELRGVITAAPTVLIQIMREENKLQEVMVGLAAHIFKYMSSEEARAMFTRAGIKESDLGMTLVQILKKYPQPQTKVPRIRRHVVELAIWMMNDSRANIETFKSLGLEQELEGIMESTSEVESFNIFSGAIGLSRYKISIHSLVETAMNLIAQR